jgi:PIN domain nuclease of toxin-antitoxin system
MSLLLDTRIFLWFISGDKRLPESMQSNIRDLKSLVEVGLD